MDEEDRMNLSNDKVNETSKLPFVSIVTVSFNRKQVLVRNLKRILNSHYPNFEVIIVDNASTDGSVELVEKLFGNDPRLRIIRNSRNLGVVARNIGVKVSKGKYLVLFDDDTEVTPNCLKELIKVMELDQTIGAAQSRIFSIFNRNEVPPLQGFIDRFGFPYPVLSNQNEITEFFYICCAAMAIRRDVINRLGSMFDPKFFSVVDTDLSWRIRLTGYRIVLAPRSVVYHGHKLKFKRVDYPFTIFNSAKNHMAMLLKNYELHNVVKYLPFFILCVTSASIYFIIKDRIHECLACIKAILWNLSNLKYVWTERLKIQHLVRQVPDKEIIKLFRKFQPTYLLTRRHQLTSIKGRLRSNR